MKTVLREDESGVSEVVGTILILAITVVLFSTIILWVGSIPVPVAQTRVDLRPTMVPIYDGTGAEIGVNITLLHQGVEALRPVPTVVYVQSQRGTNPPQTVTVILYKFNPVLGIGLLDGSDSVWDIGERWAYRNFLLRSSDQITITIVDVLKNSVVWTGRITAPVGTRPPVFTAKWADDLSGTATIDPVQATLGFLLYGKVVDPDNDLNRNSVFATMTIWFGTNSTCVNAQKMKDDGVYPDLAAGDDVFTLGKITCMDPPYPSLNWDHSIVLMNATDKQGHKTTTRLELTVIPRSGGGGGSAGTSFIVTAADQVTTAATMTTVTDMGFALLPNRTYMFRFWVIFRSSSSTNGIRLSLTFPTTVRFAATVSIPNGFDGTVWLGWITSSGDAVISSNVQSSNTDYIATIEGIIRVSVAGNLQLTFGSETSGVSVTVRMGTVGEMTIAA